MKTEYEYTFLLNFYVACSTKTLFVFKIVCEKKPCKKGSGEVFQNSTGSCEAQTFSRAGGKAEEDAANRSATELTCMTYEN